MQRLLAPIALIALVASCASDAENAAYDATVASGRAVAETRCASCHAIGNHGESTVRAAPPFRYILDRYSAASLETDLSEGIRVAHAMPTFNFDPKEADALIAYLRSIRSSAPPDDMERRKTP